MSDAIAFSRESNPSLWICKLFAVPLGHAAVGTYGSLGFDFIVFTISGLKCIDKKCVGYNAKRNLYELYQSILSPLLRYNVPRELSKNIENLLMSLNTLKPSALKVAQSLWELSPKCK